MLSNGRTAIEGLSGSTGAIVSPNGAPAVGSAPATGTRNTRTGRVMFLTWCSPRSSSARSSLSRTWSRAEREMQMPPGGVSASIGAATLTPSPWMSSPVTITSPTLMPIRKTMRRPCGTSAFRAAISPWISTAHSTASTTLGNSTSRPSPISLTMRPWCVEIAQSISASRCDLRRASVPTSSASMSRLYPTTSTHRIAASLRSTLSPATAEPPNRNELLKAVYGSQVDESNGAVEGHAAHRAPMSVPG